MKLKASAVALAAAGIVVSAVGACSSESRTETTACGSAHTDFEVSNEVVLNTPIVDDLAIDSELRKAYVPYENRDAPGGILIVDLDKAAVTDKIPFDNGVGTGALTLDTKSHLLYVAEDTDSVVVLDGKTGERVRSLEVQGGAGSLAIDSNNRVLYTVNGDYELQALNPETGEAIATIELPFNPAMLAVDETNQTVYAASTGGIVATIDTSKNAVVATIDVKGSDGGLAVDTANHRVLASNSVDGVISVIDAGRAEVTDVFADFNTPYSMARCGDALFVAHRDPGDVVVADASNGEIAQTLSIGTFPEAMAVDSKTGNVWVLSEGDTARTTPGLLSVIAPKR